MLNETLGTIDVVWDLSHLYSGQDDPRIQEDLSFVKEEAKEIESGFKGKVKELPPEGVLELVKRHERLSQTFSRISSFAQLDFFTDCTNPEKSAFLQKIREEGSAIQKHLIFFELEWQKVDDEQALTLLSDHLLREYAHYLSFLRRYTPYTLSEAEEKILIEISPVGRSSWVALFDKVMAAILYGNEKRTQEEILSDLYSPDRAIRIKAHQEFTEGLGTQEHVFTHCFNTVLAEKAIEDRLRGYPSWLTSMNLESELLDETVDILISSVTKHYAIVESYYEKKKKILGLRTLYDYDRYAPIEGLPEEVITWEECKKIVLDAYFDFSKRLGEIAQRFFDDGWIHAPVVPGKTSGAFAHPTVPDCHPYILVNYTGRLRDVETVAHELGHGVHQYLSRGVGFFNSRTPLPLAETASVFGEMLVFKRLIERYKSKDARRALLAGKIESIFATVFRQVAMNRFEHAIHSRRRDKGELSPDEFGRLWIETQQEMFGRSVRLTREYSHWWSYISHFIHSPGYVYSYAFGELLVLALYNMYEKGEEGFIEKYEALLASGGKESPYELLRPFGIDLNDPEFWKGGLSVIERMVDEIKV